jgi:hypothetical protein
MSQMPGSRPFKFIRKGNNMLELSMDYDVQQMAADMLENFCADLGIEPCGRVYGRQTFSPVNEQRLRQASRYLREMISAARALAGNLSRLGLDQGELHDYFLDHLGEMVALSLEQAAAQAAPLH